MPEVYFHIQWPDGEVTECYSPSSIVREHFQMGQVLTVEKLIDTSNEAFAQASERVRAKFGFSCSSASDQLRRILDRASNFASDQEITITAIE